MGARGKGCASVWSTWLTSGLPGGGISLALPGEEPSRAAPRHVLPLVASRQSKRWEMSPGTGRGALGRRGRLAGEGAPGQVAASPSPPHRKARPRLGRRTVGRLAGSSPRKWLTQRLRRALGMLQMVEHRCRMDRGCPAGSPEPASVLSYFTPFSKIFATWKGSPQKAPHQSTRLQPSRGSVYFAAMRK